MEHFHQNIEGWFNFPDLYAEVVRNAKNYSHFVEIGSWKGASASFMAVEIINSGKDIRFDCVDTWQGSPENADDPSVINRSLFTDFVRNMQPVSGKYTPVIADSRTASTFYMDDSLDFVFIDGAHDYQSVLEDIRLWYPKVKKGGILAGHDIEHPPVAEAVEYALNITPYEIKGPCWLTHK